MTIITQIQALPTSPFEGTGFVGIVITSGVPSFFKISGEGLDSVKSIRWYPKNPGSVKFELRELILVDSTVGTFMVRVVDNMLDIHDRAGFISIATTQGETFTFPVKTYGPVSAMPLWKPTDAGLITG